MTRLSDWRTYAKDLEIIVARDADEVAALVHRAVLIALHSRRLRDCEGIAVEVADDVKKELTRRIEA